MFRRCLWPLVCGAALVGACRSVPQSDDGSSAPANLETMLLVDNQGFLDMTVYVLDGAQRIRLGIANGHVVTNLTIPSHLIRGGGPLRFLGDPIGGNRAPVSDEIVVQPGDVVRLTIPPN